MEDPYEEIKTLKSIVRRYEKEVDTLTSYQDSEKIFLQIRHLQTELNSVKKRSKTFALERDRLERELIKQANVVSGLKESLKDAQKRSRVPVGKEHDKDDDKWKQKMDEMEKRYKLEIKVLKHESGALRSQVHAHEQTIQSQKDEIEQLSTKIKQKERIIASFAIWRKSLIYTENKKQMEQERIESIKKAVPFPSLLSVHHPSETSVLIRFKIDGCFQVDETLKALKIKEGYKSEEGGHLEEKDLTLYLNSDDGDIKMDMPIGKDGIFEFTVNKLDVGRTYWLSAYVREERNHVESEHFSFTAVSDVIPDIPSVNVTYDCNTNSFVFHLQKTKQTVRFINIYALDMTDNQNKLILKADMSGKDDDIISVPVDHEGFFVFQAGQINGIGESKLCEPIAMEVLYPAEPQLVNIHKTIEDLVAVEFKCVLENTSNLLIRTENSDKDEILSCGTQIVNFHLKPIKGIKSTDVICVAESKGGQRSSEVKVTVVFDKIPAVPKPPDFLVKSTSSALVFPSKLDEKKRKTAIQVRYKHEAQITELEPTVAVSGVLVADLPDYDTIQVSMRYAIDEFWSVWSEWETISLTSGLALPPSNPNISRPSRTPTISEDDKHAKSPSVSTNVKLREKTKSLSNATRSSVALNLNKKSIMALNPSKEKPFVSGSKAAINASSKSNGSSLMSKKSTQKLTKK